MRSRAPLLAAGTALATTVLLVSLRVFAEGSADTEIKAPPGFDEQPFSEEKTPLPEKKEWESAAKVTLDPAFHSSSCEGRRVREWVRLRCTGGSFGAIRLLGGKRDGTQMRLYGPSEEFNEFPDTMDIIVPVRRGDSRVFEVMNIEFGYHGSTAVTPFLVVSEHWPAEDEKPTISLQ